MFIQAQHLTVSDELLLLALSSAFRALLKNIKNIFCCTTNYKGSLHLEICQTSDNVARWSINNLKPGNASQK